MRTKSMFTALALVLLLSTFCHAGGPLVVGGPALGTRPAFGTDGVAFTWNPAAMPIQYRVDPGPMATTASGAVVISNATGLQRVRSMFNVWQSVPTATVSFNNAGPILPTGAYTGGDVNRSPLCWAVPKTTPMATQTVHENLG
jgi:hypothetical protein